MYKSKVKFKLVNKQFKHWDEFYYEPYMPILETKTKKELSDLKKILLLTLENAKSLNKEQTVKIGNAIYTLKPDGDEKILKRFSSVRW